MAWTKIDTEEVTGPDDQRWEIDLLTGATKFVSPEGVELRAGVAGKKQYGVKASAHRGEDHQFEVVAWVPSPHVAAAKTAVMKEARRRIDQGDWTPSADYELR